MIHSPINLAAAVFIGILALMSNNGRAWWKDVMVAFFTAVNVYLAVTP